MDRRDRAAINPVPLTGRRDWHDPTGSTTCSAEVGTDVVLFDLIEELVDTIEPAGPPHQDADGIPGASLIEARVSRPDAQSWGPSFIAYSYRHQAQACALFCLFHSQP